MSSFSTVAGLIAIVSVLLSPVLMPNTPLVPGLSSNVEILSEEEKTLSAASSIIHFSHVFASQRMIPFIAAKKQSIGHFHTKLNSLSSECILE